MHRSLLSIIQHGLTRLPAGQISSLYRSSAGSYQLIEGASQPEVHYDMRKSKSSLTLNPLITAFVFLILLVGSVSAGVLYHSKSSSMWFRLPPGAMSQSLTYISVPIIA